MDLITVNPPPTLWRVGRIPDPVAYSPAVGIEHLNNDTAGHRYDLIWTPHGTLYAATTREAAFAEVLLPFPVADLPDLLPEEDSIGAGYLDATFRTSRRICELSLSTTTEMQSLDFVDITDAHNLGVLTKTLKPALAVMDVERLNLSVVTSSRRSVTHFIAEAIASVRDENGNRRYAGIRYASKHGTNYECWAIFGGLNVSSSAREPDLSDEDLQRVAKRYELRLH